MKTTIFRFFPSTATCGKANINPEWSASFDSESGADSEPTTLIEDICTPLLETLATVQGQKMLPSLKEVEWLAEYYKQRSSEADITEVSDLTGQMSICGAPITTLRESVCAESADTPGRLNTKIPLLARLSLSRPINVSPRFRGRHRSGDLIRPMSLMDDTTDVSFFIEGGKYCFLIRPDLNRDNYWYTHTLVFALSRKY